MLGGSGGDPMGTSQRVGRGFHRLGCLFVKRILAGVVIAVMLTSTAAAGPFEEGLAAAERGDFATALRLWRPLAEHGDAVAQSGLGILYAEGRGVPQDHAEAAKWNRLAAEQGYALAQYNLGVSYDTGEGVPQDDAEAVAPDEVKVELGRRRAGRGSTEASDNGHRL